MGIEFLPSESIVLLDEGLGDALQELAPDQWRKFTVLRDRLGLTCRYSRSSLSAAFAAARSNNEQRFTELLRSIGYPGA